MEPAVLRELLLDVPARFSGDETTVVTGVAYRSDSVRPGDVFFCVPGFVHDGHDYASDAVARGAVAVVASAQVAGVGETTLAMVADTRVALARASARFHGLPSTKLDVVGVTGTNGKTTTTYLTDSVLRTSGRRTGLIGTVETSIAGERVSAVRTTPESADLQELFARMVEAGCACATMEVSSHAIDLHRVDAVRFAVAAFTNLTQDHLDFHHTLEEYASVKTRLFTQFDVGERVVNVDDPLGARIAAETSARWTTGRSSSAVVRAEDVRLFPDSAEFRLVAPAGVSAVRLPLTADYNVDNALTAAACALALGVGFDDVVEGLQSAPQVPGRLERVDAGQAFTVLVDYAHTPDSLGKAIEAVKRVTPGRVITVFGCGGDRDPEKRSLMGAAAGVLSDLVIITSDNPRSEDPVGIILQIEDGLRRTGAAYEIEVDRRKAIASAFGQATSGDAVLLAGKGHEGYQQFAERKTPFDDRVVAREELERLC